MEEVLQEIREMRAELKMVRETAEKTRKYMLWTLLGSIAVFVLPFLLILGILPSLLSGYGNLLQ